METPDKCKQIFLDDLNNTIEFYNDIDDRLPVENTGELGTPPEWWVDMMNLQREMYKIKNKHKL